MPLFLFFQCNLILWQLPFCTGKGFWRNFKAHLVRECALLFNSDAMEKIAEILKWVDLTWFTVLLKWERIQRYVVAFTDNKERSLELLEAQVKWYSKAYDNITIGWWTNRHWDVFIDIWTSTDSLSQALQLKRYYHQEAIWDFVKGWEIS